MKNNWLLSTHETPLLSEAAEVINEISVKILSQFLISNINTSFEETFDPLIINSIIEVNMIEFGPTIENINNYIKDDINEIKYNHLKSIVSATINLSANTFFTIISNSLV